MLSADLSYILVYTLPQCRHCYAEVAQHNSTHLSTCKATLHHYILFKGAHEKKTASGHRTYIAYELLKGNQHLTTTIVRVTMSLSTNKPNGQDGVGLGNDRSDYHFERITVGRTWEGSLEMTSVEYIL